MSASLEGKGVMLQASTGVGTNGATVRMTRQLLHSQGLTSLYRGLTPAVIGAGPAHALYYAVYEQMKEVLGPRRPGQRPVTVATAGVCLQCSHAAISSNVSLKCLLGLRLRGDTTPLQSVATVVMVCSEG